MGVNAWLAWRIMARKPVADVSALGAAISSESMRHIEKLNVADILEWRTWRVAQGL